MTKEEYLNINLDDLGFSNRVKRIFNRTSLSTVRDLCSRTDRDLLRYRNFGKKCVKEIKEKLAEMGLRLLDTSWTGIRHEELVGHVYIPAGILMVCDPCMVEHMWNYAPDSDDDCTFNFTGANEATMTPHAHGTLHSYDGTVAGVSIDPALSSGNRKVPVTVLRRGRDNKITKVTIHFDE